MKQTISASILTSALVTAITSTFAALGIIDGEDGQTAQGSPRIPRQSRQTRETSARVVSANAGQSRQTAARRAKASDVPAHGDFHATVQADGRCKLPMGMFEEFDSIVLCLADGTESPANRDSEGRGRMSREDVAAMRASAGDVMVFTQTEPGYFSVETFAGEGQTAQRVTRRRSPAPATDDFGGDFDDEQAPAPRVSRQTAQSGKRRRASQAPTDAQVKARENFAAQSKAKARARREEELADLLSIARPTRAEYDRIRELEEELGTEQAPAPVAPRVSPQYVRPAAPVTREGRKAASKQARTEIARRDNHAQAAQRQVAYRVPSRRS
jgi:hypothetical protein